VNARIHEFELTPRTFNRLVSFLGGKLECEYCGRRLHIGEWIVGHAATHGKLRHYHAGCWKGLYN
jgi:hypothetical protein